MNRCSVKPDYIVYSYVLTVMNKLEKKSPINGIVFLIPCKQISHNYNTFIKGVSFLIAWI
jgi:hypothetical protein